MRDLYLADHIYYWLISGKRATMIEWRTLLSHDVDAGALERAVRSALQVHVNFRGRPVIRDGRVRIDEGGLEASVGDSLEASAGDSLEGSAEDGFKESTGEVPVFPESGGVRRIGSRDTYGFLFYFSFRGREVIFHLFHALADGKGSLAFLKTVLCCYLKETEGLAYMLPEETDTEPIYERILKEYAGMPPRGRFDAARHDIFRIPVSRFTEDDTRHRVFEIDVPLAPLLAISKKSESSVVPTMQAMIGYAIRGIYPVGRKMITASTPIDLRAAFGMESGGNGTSIFAVPYDARLDKYDLPVRSTLLRGALDLQIQPENLYVGVMESAGLIEQVTQQPAPIEQVAPVVSAMATDRQRAAFTYSITYPGKVRFPEAASPYVEAVTCRSTSYILPMTIAACEYGGVIRMTITQSFDEDTLVRAIFREMQRYIPETVLADYGMHWFDACGIW